MLLYACSVRQSDQHMHIEMLPAKTKIFFRKNSCPLMNTTHLAELYRNHRMTLWFAAAVPRNTWSHHHCSMLWHSWKNHRAVGLSSPIAMAEKQLDSSQKVRTALYIGRQLPIIPLRDLTRTQDSSVVLRVWKAGYVQPHLSLTKSQTQLGFISWPRNLEALLGHSRHSLRQLSQNRVICLLTISP